MGIWGGHPTLRALTYAAAVLVLYPLVPLLPIRLSSLFEPHSSVGAAWEYMGHGARVALLVSIALPFVFATLLFRFARGARISGLLLFGVAASPWALGLLAKHAYWPVLMDVVEQAGISGLAGVPIIDFSGAELPRALGAGVAAFLFGTLSLAIVGERFAHGARFVRCADGPHWPLLGALLTAGTATVVAALACVSGVASVKLLEEIAPLDGLPTSVLASQASVDFWRTALPLGTLLAGSVYVAGVCILLKGRARFLGIAVWFLLVPVVLVDLSMNDFAARRAAADHELRTITGCFASVRQRAPGLPAHEVRWRPGPVAGEAAAKGISGTRCG